MYYDKNKRYFENKRLLLYIGLGVLAASAVLFYIWPVDMDNVRIISFIVVPVFITGCALFFIPLMRRSSERDINENIEQQLRDFDADAYYELDMDGHELPYITSFTVKGFVYYDTPYVRRDSEGNYRTDRYCKTNIYFSEKELRIASRTVHLTDDGTTTEYVRIPYKDITDAGLSERVKEYDTGKKILSAGYYELNIYGDGGVIYSCQTKYDYTVECAVTDIKNLSKRAKE